MLILAYDYLDDIYLEYISNALRKNDTLTFLDIGGNVFGNEGLTHLNDTLEYNSTLIKIELIDIDDDDSWEHLDPELLESITQKVENNKLKRKILTRKLLKHIDYA